MDELQLLFPGLLGLLVAAVGYLSANRLASQQHKLASAGPTEIDSDAGPENDPSVEQLELIVSRIELMQEQVDRLSERIANDTKHANQVVVAESMDWEGWSLGQEQLGIQFGDVPAATVKFGPAE